MWHLYSANLGTANWTLEFSAPTSAECRAFLLTFKPTTLDHLGYDTKAFKLTTQSL